MDSVRRSGLTCSEAKSDNSLLPLLDVFEAVISGIGGYPDLDRHKTEAALAGSGIRCPRVTGELLAR